MDDTQLLKGILEGCILSVISAGETYGYEIMQTLSDVGFTEIQEGTLYPILTRLEKNGYVKCRKEKSPLGPIRKYFSITQDGKERLAGFKANYRNITNIADRLLGEE